MTLPRLIEKYSRNVFNLSKNDILAIAYHLDINEINENTTRELICAHISLKDPNILDKNYKYYFAINEDHELEVIDSSKILDYSIFKEKPFTQKRKIDDDKIKKYIDTLKSKTTSPEIESISDDENNKDEKIKEVLDGSKSHSCPNLNENSQNKDNMAEIAKVFETVLNKKEQSTKKLPNAHNILGVKLKYEQSRGIDSFLSLIDTFASTYQITDPSEKVKIALLALDNSDHGLTVKQILSKEDCQDWDLFRSKLQSLLGRDSDSYKEEFDNWANNTDPPTLAIARLITIFKFSFDPPKESLSEEDERRLIRKFIKAQNQPIKGYLLAEQERLDLKTLGQRTQQLFRAFNIQNDPFYNVNNIVQALNTDDKNHNLISKDSPNKPQRSNRRNYFDRNDPNRRPNRNFSRNYYNNYNFRGRNRRPNQNRPIFDYSKLQGYCIDDLTSECRYPDCKYKHRSENIPVPESVVLAAASFASQNQNIEEKKT